MPHSFGDSGIPFLSMLFAHRNTLFIKKLGGAINKGN